VTFASPHPGDGDFVDQYPATIPLVRFENYLDIVPFLPPTDTFVSLMHSFFEAVGICDCCPAVCSAVKKAEHWNYQSPIRGQSVTSAFKLTDGAADCGECVLGLSPVLGVERLTVG